MALLRSIAEVNENVAVVMWDDGEKCPLDSKRVETAIRMISKNPDGTRFMVASDTAFGWVKDMSVFDIGSDLRIVTPPKSMKFIGSHEWVALVYNPKTFRFIEGTGYGLDGRVAPIQ